MYAEKLKSGKYRVKLPVGKTDDGKYIYKSFTADTKKEAVKLAEGYEPEDNAPENITLRKAFEQYNEIKGKVLSPSTMRNYVKYPDLHFGEYLDYKVSRIDNKVAQSMVNRFSTTVSPKTVKNIYGYLCSAMKFAGLEAPKVTYPQKKKYDYHIITDEEMKNILAEAKETDYILYVAILLAYSIPARRGEISALTEADIDRENCTVTINKDMVMDEFNCWQVKEPKTYSSNRKVKVDKRIIDAIPVPYKMLNPKLLGERFRKLLARLGYDFRFHDLRHYGCTNLLNSKVPIKTVCYVGGWSNPTTPLTIYGHYTEDTMDEALEAMSSKLNSLI